MIPTRSVPVSSPAPRRALLLLFFGSGASGLVYQVLWMRALSLTMSVSVYAATTVLCAFMAGLALGAMLAGRVADRLTRPFLAFGLAEMGVGVTGFFALRLLFGLAPAEVWIHDAFGGGGIAMTAARFVVAFAVLVVPCTLMGATLPQHRGRGVQRALLRARILAARELGARTLSADTGVRRPGLPDASYRNLEWAGFREAYVREHLTSPLAPR